MSFVTKITILTLMLSSAPALACDLDDCTLSDALHTVEQDPVPEDAWSWINHDLAVARTALKIGERSRAIALVRELDSILRTQLKAIVAVRGADKVRALHTALQDLSLSSGGWPLAELDVVVTGARG